MLNRRQLLHLAAGTGVGLGLATTGAPPALAADEYDTLRQRWIDNVLQGTGYNPATEPFAGHLAQIGSNAANFRSTMSPSGSSLWPDLPIGTVSANVSSSYGRLRWMAQAWAFPGTGLTGNSNLLAEVIAGLDWMHANAYTPTTTPYNNWWDWEIGSSRLLLDIITLIYGSLTSTRISNYLASVDHFVPDPTKQQSGTRTSTGANRVDLCRVVILRGVLGKSSAKIATGRNALAQVFPLVRNGDGFYADGSFIQHGNVPYIGTYGFVLIDGLANLFALLAGSTWAITDPNRQFIFDAVPNAIAPFMFNGLMMDGQSGRAISRGVRTVDNPLQLQQDDHARGHNFIGAILLLAGATSATEAAQWRAMAKGWLQRDYWSPMLSDRSMTLPALARAKGILDNGAISPVAEPIESRVFGSMDRATHRRANWAWAVAMCSSRTKFYEAINGENLHGWHTGSGMTYWWGDTYGNGQYSDAYWPTVDPYRLPGTTVSRKPLAYNAGANTTPPAGTLWVGGATDGTYSALGQDTRGVTSTLVAKKSWFCLDDQVVCLGAGISASDGYTLVTTVDNRNLGATSSTALIVDGTTQPTTLGWSGTFTNASWAVINGFGGYVFPGGATVKATRQERTGAWSDINTGSSTTPLTRRYLTLWFDHGVDPSGAGYRYILMPGANSATTSARAASPTVSILSNTDSVQAITDSATGVTAANFFAAGTAGPITVSAPCSVLMRESGGTLSVSVADPTRAATTITVTINRSGYTKASGDNRIGVTGLNPIRLVVEVGGGHGASRTITFGTGATITAGQAMTLAPSADAYVRDGSYASTNYGSETELVIKNSGTGYHRRSFLKFDVSSLPASPRRAVLWVRGNTADSGGTQATIGAYAVAGDTWTETGITWNNQPLMGTQQSENAIGSLKDWIPLDVTSYVQSQYAGDKTATIGLAEAAPGVAVVLASRNATGSRPFLQLITG